VGLWHRECVAVQAIEALGDVPGKLQDDHPHETFDYATPASVYGQAFVCATNL